MTPAGARNTPTVASMRAIIPITAPPGGTLIVVPDTARVGDDDPRAVGGRVAVARVGTERRLDLRAVHRRGRAGVPGRGRVVDDEDVLAIAELRRGDRRPDPRRSELSRLGLGGVGEVADDVEGDRPLDLGDLLSSVLEVASVGDGRVDTTGQATGLVVATGRGWLSLTPDTVTYSDPATESLRTVSMRRVPGISPLIDSDGNVSTTSSLPSELRISTCRANTSCAVAPAPTVLCVASPYFRPLPHTPGERAFSVNAVRLP